MKTSVEWTHNVLPDGRILDGFTFNPWWGCEEVSPGCAYCYAKAGSKRYGWSLWGSDADRRFFGEKHWKHLADWDALAGSIGFYHLVFCASYADLFEQLPLEHPFVEQMDVARGRMWQEIEIRKNLFFLLVTKRVENVARLVPPRWMAQGFPKNVMLIPTVESQPFAWRVDAALQLPAQYVGVSVEPMLGNVDLEHIEMRDAKKRLARLAKDGIKPVGGSFRERNALRGEVIKGHIGYAGRKIDWAIYGGESRSQRACHVDWIRAGVGQCQRFGVPAFVKQLGSHPTFNVEVPDSLSDWPEGTTWDWKFNRAEINLKDVKGGDMDEWAPDLRVRQFPAFFAKPLSEVA